MTNMLIPLLEALVIAGCLTIAGGAIGAIGAAFTFRQEIDHLWEAHAHLWERLNQPRHHLDREPTE